MLKKRVIPLLLLKDGRMVKGRQFKNYRETGLPESCIRIYSAQDADELCFINIGSDRSEFEGMSRILKMSCEECFMPLTAGGGIKTEDDVERLFDAGTDKVLLTSEAYRDITLLTKTANRYGTQSIVAGIDYYEVEKRRVVAIDRGRTRLDIDILEYAISLEDAGAGEILLNCISRDGTMAGYDIDTATAVNNTVNIPVIVCGGAGDYSHLAKAFVEANVSGAACASLFHFGDNNPIRARSYLKNNGIPMRRVK
jgi:cyclase